MEDERDDNKGYVEFEKESYCADGLIKSLNPDHLINILNQQTGIISASNPSDTSTANSGNADTKE